MNIMNVMTGHYRGSVAFRGLSDRLDAKWQALCERYLPITSAKYIWRYSRRHIDVDPCQGWKLHISATILTACEVFETVAPHLERAGMLFKAPGSLQELHKINSGLYYGYSQIGKFITVYPRSSEEAVSLAQHLHRLTLRQSAPSVPFDLRFKPGSSIYYRYGSFKHLEIENQDGALAPAIRDPSGNLVPDCRESVTAKPDWAINPFVDEKRPGRSRPCHNPLKTTYAAFEALTQRGKGGVYKALDLSARPTRLAILKEGRRDGEVTWDGRDGRWRVQHEEKVLKALCAADVAVPEVYASFEAENNYYLVTEFVEGRTLHAFLYKRRRRLSVRSALGFAIKLSSLLSAIHAAGWAWRDCKPKNIIVTKSDALRPIDFEGASPIDLPDYLAWSTQGFIHPERDGVEERLSQKYDDLYALGAVLYFLLAGQLPDASALIPLEKLRAKIPVQVHELVVELLSADPWRRPEAACVRQRLTAVLRDIKRTGA